jgi:endonuclease/exonuclease/phosphatase (EEP) superfamily protein YafD
MIADWCIGIIVAMLCLERIGLRHWFFRWPAYFLRQVVIALILLCVVKIIWGRLATSLDYTLLILAGVAVIFGLLRLFSYTKYGSKSVQDCADSSPSFTLLISNVQYDNPNYDGLPRLILREQPDILIVLELTPTWHTHIDKACADYPYRHTVVREDPFGLGIWSRHAIKSHDVYTVHNDYPTMRCVMRIQDQDIILWVMHPVPPAPGDADTSEPKDSEFAIVSRVIDGENEMTIVVGDLNDVAWSTATRKFIKRSKLMDPRRGRGFINTFPTYAAWLGFPLDQIFVSRHLCIRRFERLEHIGSDHFPLLAELAKKDRTA